MHGMWRLFLIICSSISPYYVDNCLFPKLELPDCQVYPMVDLSNRRIEHLHGGSFTFEWGKQQTWNPVVELMNGIHENTDTFNVSLTKTMILYGNKLRTLGMDALNGLPMLMRLDLSYCEIGKLERGCFRHINNLTELNLEGNELSDFDHEVFDHLNVLRSLILSHNRLKSVILNELRMLERLDLSYNEISHFREHTLFTRNNLTHLNLEHNNFYFIPIISGGKLQYLDISSNKLNELGDLDTFSSLKKLFCRNHTIRYISNETFQTKANLDTVDMRDGTLQHISDYAFRYCPKLRVLNLANNDLNSTMPWISSTRSVQKMDLSGNPLIPSFFEAFRAGPIPVTSVVIQTFPMNLLWLNNVGLEHLPKFSEFLVELKYLQLRDNGMHSMEMHCFSNLDMLTELDLSNNRLADIDLANIFQNPSLERLKLSGNKITTLIFINSHRPLNLQHLDVSNNRIQTVLLHDTPENRISFLNISGNRLILWDSHFQITGIKLLQQLDISHNKFTSLETRVFANLNITTLIASHNLITGFNCTSMPDVFNVTVKLDLSHNLISEWPSCMNLLLSCQELLISYNMHLALPPRLVTSGQLKTLDVSGNGLEAIPRKPASDSSGINNLILRQNAISIIPDNLCHFMKDLRTIDLRENHISLLDLSKLEKCGKLQDFKVSKYMVSTLEYSMAEMCDPISSSCLDRVHRFSFTGPKLGTLQLTSEEKTLSQPYFNVPKCKR